MFLLRAQTPSGHEVLLIDGNAQPMDQARGSAATGGKCVFIGRESIDPANLADVSKGFDKPGEYAAVLERLALHNV
jgi:hypothetical protein